MSIVIDHVSKTFRTGAGIRQVLRDITLEVAPGEVFALMGPNGSGKTTLLKILSTVILPAGGTARVNGFDILERPEQVRASLGAAFDAEHSFYQMLSLEDNIRFFGRLRGLSRAALENGLDRLCGELGLEPYRRERFGHCSSGVRQKASILRAFIADPPVLLFDEPTRSLDERSRREFAEYLGQAAVSSGRSCIFVTHDAAEARLVARRAGTLADGVLREDA